MANSGAADLPVWRHGVVEAKGDAGFVFMVAKGGFAEKEGLKVEVSQFKGDTLALKALLAGDLDSYEGNPGGMLLAGARGADIKVVGCYWPGLTYGIYAKPALGAPGNLRGRTLAISAPGALPDLMARAVLAKYGIPSNEERFTAMGSDADRFRALTAGIVDAAAVSIEFQPLAEKAGLKLLARGDVDLPNYIRLCIYTSGKTISSRGNDAARFLAADMNALRFSLNNKDKVIQLTREVTGAKQDDPRPEYIFDEAKRRSWINPDMPVPLDKLSWMEDLLVQTGNLSGKVDVKSLVDDGPRKKALQLIAGQPAPAAASTAPRNSGP